MSNCSNQGSCSYSNVSLVCSCRVNYTGRTCDQAAQACSSSPCINNGTCSESLVDKTYKCQCDSKFFYGRNCENRVDLCLNRTCSGNGYCLVRQNEAVCKCFEYYSGTNCDQVAAARRLVQACVTLSTVCAIICIVSLYSLMILLDLDKLFRFLTNKKQLTTKALKNNKFAFRSSSKKNKTPTNTQKFEYIP